MSKFLNRNVNTAFSIFSLPHRTDDNTNNVDNNEKFSNFLIKSEEDKTFESDIESIILDLNKLGGLSSSSSLSWSDDYETETTKKVYDELNRLDKVFKGEESIPPNYDSEECQEWMEYFPYLSIFDDDKTPTNSVENLSCNTNLHYNTDPPLNHDCDMLASDQTSTVLNITIPMLKSNAGTPLIHRKRSLKNQNGYLNNKLVSVYKPKSLDIDQYLKVSPAVHNKRKQSSKSLLNKHISRESPDNHPEYSSLPHIKIESLPSLKLQKSSQHIKKKMYSKTGRNDNRLILPPIDRDQFRSVSALPSENFKTLSTLSVNLNYKQKLSKKKHSSEPVKNPVSSRRQRNLL